MEWKSKSQRESLGKTRNQEIEVKSKLFSQKPFSLIFQTLAKIPNRLFNLNPKTSFDCCENTRENSEISSKKFLEKTSF